MAQLFDLNANIFSDVGPLSKNKMYVPHDGNIIPSSKERRATTARILNFDYFL